MRLALNNLRIATKLSLGFVVVSLLFLVVIAFCLIHISVLRQETNLLTQDYLPLLTSLSQVSNLHIQHASHLERAIRVKTDGKEDSDKLFQIEKKAFLDGSSQVSIEIDACKVITEHLSQDRTTYFEMEKHLLLDYELRGIDERHSKYQFIATRILNLLSQSKYKKAREDIEELDIATIELNKSIDDLSDSLTSLMVSYRVRRQLSEKKTTIVSVIVILAMVVSIVGFISWFTRGIKKPLTAAVDMANRIASGERNVKIDIISKDEVGILLQSLTQMLKSVKALEIELESKAITENNRAEELDYTNKQLKEAQLQIVQVGKLAAVGELSAGIAHELNQPITSIRGFIQLLSRNIKSLDSNQTDMIERILKATDRMSRIITNLRLFGRQSDFLMTNNPATESLEAALELVSEQLRIHEIRVDKIYEEELPNITGESIQLQQVFLNLLSNARYALDREEKEKDKCLLLSAKSNGKHVVYAVEDNGPGVPEENVDKLFDPFFTTKPPGEGMGLGLSLSYGIVKEHSGEMTYERASSGGARFIVKIPMVKPADITDKIFERL